MPWWMHRDLHSGSFRWKKMKRAQCLDYAICIANCQTFLFYSMFPDWSLFFRSSLINLFLDTMVRSDIRPASLSFKDPNQHEFNFPEKLVMKHLRTKLWDFTKFILFFKLSNTIFHIGTHPSKAILEPIYMSWLQPWKLISSFRMIRRCTIY